MAAGALMASIEADKTVAGARRTVEEASFEQIATAIEGKAEEVPEPSSTAAGATSEAAS